MPGRAQLSNSRMMEVSANIGIAQWRSSQVITAEGKNVALTLNYSLKPESMDTLNWEVEYKPSRSGSSAVADKINVPMIFKRPTSKDSSGNGILNGRDLLDAVFDADSYRHSDHRVQHSNIH